MIKNATRTALAAAGVVHGMQLQAGESVTPLSTIVLKGLFLAGLALELSAMSIKSTDTFESLLTEAELTLAQDAINHFNDNRTYSSVIWNLLK